MSARARDYFALFQLEPGFKIDHAALKRAYHALLDQFHPDRFAGKPQVEQRLAVQFCADINSGFRTLSDDVYRAEYLLGRQQVDLKAAEREGVGSEFLMTQISLRERLESSESDQAEEREQLLHEINGHYTASLEQFDVAASGGNWCDAARFWQEMCYLSKLLEVAETEGR
jgi:molecular chaperone HscB